ncbi:MAG TPA: anti-sigma factor [Bacteroidota bacterium]|nr:anti-sigma factor [Bacteroidota bacterium]
MEQRQRHTFLDLCLPYALGRLNEGQRRQFEAHLRTGCNECNRELAEIQESLSILPLLHRQQSAPRSLKESIIRQIRQEEKPAAGQPALPGVGRPWFGYGIAAVIALILVGLMFYVASLHDTITQQDRQLVELRDELERKEEILQVLQAPRINVVILKGAEVHPAGYGKIIWDPEKRVAVFQVANLPPIPEDKDYQLWVIKDKTPISTGVFSIQHEKESYFKVLGLTVADRNEIEAFAVTLEPKGGLPKPSGAVYMIGSPQ